MNKVELILVDCESGDWVAVYVDGKLEVDGHNIYTDTWVDLIQRYKSFKSVSRFTVTDDYMESGLPYLFSDIPDEVF